jgi:hypothetical protein
MTGPVGSATASSRLATLFHAQKTFKKCATKMKRGTQAVLDSVAPCTICLRHLTLGDAVEVSIAALLLPQVAAWRVHRGSYRRDTHKSISKRVRAGATRRGLLEGGHSSSAVGFGVMRRPVTENIATAQGQADGAGRRSTRPRRKTWCKGPVPPQMDDTGLGPSEPRTGRGCFLLNSTDEGGDYC